MIETQTPVPATPQRPHAAARASVDVYVYLDTAVEMRDFGTGSYVRIGADDGKGGYVDINLGYDDTTRHDACDRLIEALTAERDWTPADAELEAVR